MVGRIPELQGDTVSDATIWFRDVIAAIGGEGWHPDDPVDDLIDQDGNRLFTDDEAVQVSAIVGRLFEVSNTWVDPDMMYTLASTPNFAAEAIWPGFIVDVSVPPCGRTGYVSMRDRELPNFVFEDSAFFIVEFPQATGPISTHGRFLLSELDGAFFNGNNDLDLTNATVDEATQVEFYRIGDVEDVMLDIIRSQRAP